MMRIPAITSKRLLGCVPRFQKILEQSRGRDINESDTVTIVTDILHEVFGFDKYQEITREYAIQGTYCDLAIKTDKKTEYLIEVKAIGTTLKESHMRQAIDYAARSGVSWVVLTNGICWEIYKITVDGQVTPEKVLDFDFGELNIRKEEDQQKLFHLCKRGVQNDNLDRFYERKQSLNKHTIGAILLAEPGVANSIRRVLRLAKSGMKVTNEEIENLLKEHVIKRDIVESEEGKDALKNVRKVLRKNEKRKGQKKPQDDGGAVTSQPLGDIGISKDSDS